MQAAAIEIDHGDRAGRCVGLQPRRSVVPPRLERARVGQYGLDRVQAERGIVD